MKTLLLIFILSIAVHAQTTDLTNVGKIGIATPSPVAIIDVDGLPNPAAVQVLRLRTNEAGSGDFGMSYFATPGSFGEPRNDNQLCIGYNIGGPGYVANEHQLGLCWESRYKTSQGRLQSEFYVAAIPGSGGGSRPLAMDFYHDDGSTQVGVFSQSFVIASPADNNPWLRFTSSPTTGIVSMVRDSKIDFSGNTREWFIVRANAGILGQSGTTGKLFTGGIGGETLNIFEGGFVNAQYPMTISLGNGGSLRLGASPTSPLRWQVTGNYAGYSDVQTAFDVDSASTANKIVKRGATGEVNVGSVKVSGVKVVGSQCAAIANSTGLPGDSMRAINELLTCLRQHGLLAP